MGGGDGQPETKDKAPPPKQGDGGLWGRITETAHKVDHFIGDVQAKAQVEKLEKEFPSKPELRDSRREFLKASENIPDPHQRELLYKNMEQFEKRSREQTPPLSQHEIAETYRQMSRLLETSDKNSKVPEKNRVLLVQDFMLHAANPGTMSQGDYSTCNVTCVAQRAMVHSPSKLAEMVSTTALTGQWKSTDGKIIQITPGSLTPGHAESIFPPGKDDHSYAMQIMNLTMTNDLLQRRTPPEYYVLDPNCPNHTPYHDYNQEKEIASGGGDRAQGKGVFLYPEDIANLSKLEFNQNQTVIVNDSAMSPNDPNRQNGDFVHISSEQDLNRALRQAKADHRLPLTIIVDKHLLVPGETPTGWNHAINITDINDDGTVVISNPKKQDGAPERNRTVSLQTVYRATQGNH